ncbi:hypothetical protein JCM8547_006032 [Rhodosporidiobolus lusitaniae]
MKLDIRTLLYLILGMPFLSLPLVSAGPTPLPPRRRSHSLRSPYSSSPSARIASRPSSFFVPSTAKLPLTALPARHDTNKHLHPQVLLQQHINRSLSRQRLMTNSSSSSLSTDEHPHRLMRRLNSLAEAEKEVEKRAMPRVSIPSRHWRGGEALAGAKAAVQHMKDRAAAILSPSRSPHSTFASSLSATARVGVSGLAGSAVSSQRAAQQTASGLVDALPLPLPLQVKEDADKEDRGFSRPALEAAQNNTITHAEPVGAANSLGLSVEANDVGYFAEVQLGDEGKVFKILMDSGSADFWVPSSACTVCGNHTSLPPPSSPTSPSSSLIDTLLPFAVTYGTGSVSGTTVSTSAVIAGLKIEGLKLGGVTRESEDFSESSVPFDGLMGLALSPLSSQSIPTPIDRLLQDGLVSAAQVGYKLGRVSDGVNDGEVTFGGVDGGKMKGEMVVVENVSKHGFWEAPLSDVLINNVSISSPSSSPTSSFSSLANAGRSAILDTGTTLIIAPPADAEAVHRMIPGARSDGQGGFTLPCTTLSTLTFSFLTTTSTSSGTVSFSMRPSDLSFLPLNDDDPEGDCVSSISSGRVGGKGEWLVGAAFLKNVYFATDAGSNMIGLAELA